MVSYVALTMFFEIKMNYFENNFDLWPCLIAWGERFL